MLGSLSREDRTFRRWLAANDPCWPQSVRMISIYRHHKMGSWSDPYWWKED